jgi:hypothetical protein
VTVDPGFACWNASPISVNVFRSDAAANTVSIPAGVVDADAALDALLEVAAADDDWLAVLASAADELALADAGVVPDEPPLAQETSPSRTPATIVPKKIRRGICDCGMARRLEPHSRLQQAEKRASA